MTRHTWLQLCPALVVAAGIIASTATVVHSGSSDWMAVGGLLLLALAVVVADALRARLQGRPARPSTAASLLGAAFVLAGSILVPISARSMATFIPIFAISAWVVLFPSSRDGERPTCGPR
jgi:drug/metabolite transporter (DMT)-like permease